MYTAERVLQIVKRQIKTDIKKRAIQVKHHKKCHEVVSGFSEGNLSALVSILEKIENLENKFNHEVA